jgi:hypothetical protein
LMYLSGNDRYIMYRTLVTLSLALTAAYRQALRTFPLSSSSRSFGSIRLSFVQFRQFCCDSSRHKTFMCSPHNSKGASQPRDNWIGPAPTLKIRVVDQTDDGCGHYCHISKSTRRPSRLFPRGVNGNTACLAATDTAS